MRLGIAALMVALCISFTGCGGNATGPAVKSDNIPSRPGSGTEKATTDADGNETSNAGSTTTKAEAM